MEPAIAALISALTSIAVALAGAYVARRKGLPSINAEIEVRNADLIRILKDQVDGLRGELEDTRSDLKAAQEENNNLHRLVRDLRRRVDLAEGELLELQRRGGAAHG